MGYRFRYPFVLSSPTKCLIHITNLPAGVNFAVYTEVNRLIWARMFSVSSFFDLPALTRFRWMNGVGAFSLACAMLARWTTDLMPGADFYPLEVVGVVTLSLFALFGHHSRWIRQHPHAAMYWVLVPTLCHFLYGHYETDITSGMLMSLGTCIVFVGMIMESVAWRRFYVMTWTAACIAVVWLGPPSQGSPFVISIIFCIVALLVCVIGAGFHAARRELADAAQLLDESQRFSGVGAWQKDYATGEIRWTKTTYDI